MVAEREDKSGTKSNLIYVEAKQAALFCFLCNNNNKELTYDLIPFLARLAHGLAL